MLDCSEMLVKTAIIDIWMGVENVKKLWIAEKFAIYIYIYIYIYKLSNLLIFRLNNVHYTIPIFLLICMI